MFHWSNKCTTVVAFPLQHVPMSPTSNLSYMVMAKLSCFKLIFASKAFLLVKARLWVYLRVGSGYSIVAMNGQLLWLFLFNIYI